MYLKIGYDNNLLIFTNHQLRSCSLFLQIEQRFLQFIMQITHMSINLDKLGQLLPFGDSRWSRMQRDLIWEKWDTNLNGFLSLEEIEVQFRTLLELSENEYISEIIKQSSEEAKKKLNIDGKFGPNYLQKRQFRSFLEHLHKHIRNLLIFQMLNCNNDISVAENKLTQAYYHIFNEQMSFDQLSVIKGLTNEPKVTFIVFSECLNSVHAYDHKVMVA